MGSVLDGMLVYTPCRILVLSVIQDTDLKGSVRSNHISTVPLGWCPELKMDANLMVPITEELPIEDSPASWSVQGPASSDTECRFDSRLFPLLAVMIWALTVLLNLFSRGKRK